MNNTISSPATSKTPVDPPPVRPTIDEKLADEMGRASFPASDPPATWTWDPR